MVFALGCVYFLFNALVPVDGDVLDVCCVKRRIKIASVMKCSQRCRSGFIKSLSFFLQRLALY